MSPFISTESALRHLEVAQFAVNQSGVVSREQLLDHGFDNRLIESQLRAGRWVRAYDGVFFTFTGPPDRDAKRWAALLACGEGAVLCHESAAEVQGFLDAAHAPQVVHVMIPESRREVSPVGVRVHRSRLMPRISEFRRGFPVTTAADTVLDLCGQTRSEATAVAWIAEACRSKQTSPTEILNALGKRKRQRHRWLIKAACADVALGVESFLEHAYLNRVERAHGLPKGRRQVNATTASGRVRRDIDYDAYTLTIELDGRRGHEGKDSFRDMRRDNDGVVKGKATLRYGHADVSAAACEVAIQVAEVLQARGWSGSPTPCGRNCPVTRKI
ncbi:MAG TPA: hypothetical protein VMT88_08620 [Actinomycetes bacterium]|nr:hypothetical protein [Actinomycetes bacterium]